MMFGKKDKEMQIKEYLEKQDKKIAEVEAKNKKLQEENDRLYDEKNKVDEESSKIGALADKWMHESLDSKENKKYWKNQAMLYQEKLVNLNKPAGKSKKYKRKVGVIELPGFSCSKEEWNEARARLDSYITNVIGNQPIEKIIGTPVNDGGVQYLIIYEEEVKE